MVEVNNKFMVRLEIDGSALAAEHYFLDGFNGVWGALAFDQKSMKTDCFIGCMMHDELITLPELENKLHAFEGMDIVLEGISNEITDVKETISKYQERLAELEGKYTENLTKWNEQKKYLNATRPN
jgi:hypothetical protein